VWGGKDGEIVREKEGWRGKEVGETQFGDGRTEETGIGAFGTTRDGNNVRRVEDVEVKWTT
jgi:hypothetical protein